MVPTWCRILASLLYRHLLSSPDQYLRTLSEVPSLVSSALAEPVEGWSWGGGGFSVPTYLRGRTCTLEVLHPLIILPASPLRERTFRGTADVLVFRRALVAAARRAAGTGTEGWDREPVACLNWEWGPTSEDSEPCRHPTTTVFSSFVWFPITDEQISRHVLPPPPPRRRCPVKRQSW